MTAAPTATGWAGDDSLLTDGSLVTVRAVRSSDEAGLRALYAREGAASLRRRFLGSAGAAVDADIRRLVGPQGPRSAALVALERGRIVGVGELQPAGAPHVAEAAVLVDDARRGVGVGTLLVEELLALARARGVTAVRAQVLAGNAPMLQVLHGLGARMRTHVDSGVVEAELLVAFGPDQQELLDAREAVAEQASIGRLVRPHSVVVIGAGRRAEGVGHRITANLVRSFQGELAVVNRRGEPVCGAPAARSVRDLPQAPDLAVVAVPATDVPAVLADCAAAGCANAVVVSDGFAETGAVGRRRQRAALAVAREAGMRLVGPNCLGLANTANGLNATFAAQAPQVGPVGIAVQSGGVGLALTASLAARGIGVSTFVSLGNKADVSGNDLLQYWETDPATRVCLLYLESFGNAEKFVRIARRVAATKPIVAVVAGRSPAGARGVRSHTAAAATPDVVVDALLAEAGVIRAGGLAEAADVVTLLASGLLPAGRRVGILTNGGGPGALAADACSAVGLEVPDLPRRLRGALRAVLPARASVANPLDASAAASPQGLAAATRLLAGSSAVDTVMVVHTALTGTDTDDLADELAPLAGADASKPVVMVALGGRGTAERAPGPSGCPPVPTYAFPESAAGAVAVASRRAAWLRRPPAKPARLGRIDAARARRLVTSALRERPAGTWLDTDVAAELLRTYGIPVVPTLPARTPDEVAARAAALAGPVAVKAAEGGLLHRTERGLVEIDLPGPEAAAEAARRIHDRAGSPCRLVVQPFVTGGVEIAVGLVRNATVGPVVMLGAGGVTTELLADRFFALPPLGRSSVRRGLATLRVAELLRGYRGAAPKDEAALVDLALRVGRLATELPEVTELDLNPVVVLESGACAVDAKVRLVPARPPADPAVRRLTSRS